MNKIIESFLDTHIKEYELQDKSKETAFEHFMNNCILNKYISERFDPDVTMTDKGERGLDGVAILINDRLICNVDEANDILLKWYNIVVTPVAIIYNNITKKRRILCHNDTN